jgi:hypothetical protein
MVEFIQAKDRYRGNINSAFAVYKADRDSYQDAGYGVFNRPEDYEEPEEKPYNPNITGAAKSDKDDIPF